MTTLGSLGKYDGVTVHNDDPYTTGCPLFLAVCLKVLEKARLPTLQLIVDQCGINQHSQDVVFHLLKKYCDKEVSVD